MRTLVLLLGLLAGSCAWAQPHPDAVFQAELRDYARDLSRARTPGVELWSSVVRRAVDHHAGRASLSIQERFDAVVRDTGAVLVGEREMRRRFDQLRRFDRSRWLNIPSARNPMIDSMLGEYDRMADDLFAGNDLDKTRCADFRPEFRDGTENQVWHTFFYVQMAYATGDEANVRRGSLYHELMDDGGSWADYDVGNWAALLGRDLRLLRNAGKLDGLYALPTLIGAIFGVNGDSYGHPNDNGGRDFRAAARETYSRVSRRLHNPAGTVWGWLTENTRRGVIAAVNLFKDRDENLGSRLGR